MACIFTDPTRVITDSTVCHCSRCQMMEQAIVETQATGIEPPRQRLSAVSYDMMDKELGVGTWELP